MKNKTFAAWLAFLGGPLGLHRMYLYGVTDTLAWLHPIPTALGLYGIRRALDLGQDDPLSWFLIPCAGFTFAATALMAIVYGLTTPEKWNARFNPGAAPDAGAGRTGWLTIGAVVAALMVGAAVLITSIVLIPQRYYEAQDAAAAASQVTNRP